MCISATVYKMPSSATDLIIIIIIIIIIITKRRFIRRSNMTTVTTMAPKGDLVNLVIIGIKLDYETERRVSVLIV